MKQHFDIVIMGAGMVGASLAVALLDHAKALGLRMAIVEPKELPATAAVGEYQPSFDSRATALAYGSAKIYQQLSLWERLSERLQPIETIHISDRGHFGAARLFAHEERVPALGYVVENQWLGEVLYEHIQQHQNTQRLRFFCPATIEKVERVGGVMQLQLSQDGDVIELSADLLVMADGGRSTLREKMGISYQEAGYQQSALVCNIELDRDHKKTAYERFTDTGPMALLPLSSQQGKHRSGLIWTVPEDEIAAMLALNETEFLKALQQRFGFRAGRFIHAGERFSYPLKLQRAQEQVRAGVVIVGNAAHSLHPMAGQGFNLALRGVASLAQQLIQAQRSGINLGDYNMLSDYQTSRLADQQAMIGFSDKSMRLFSTANPLLATGRDIGLQLLDMSPALKTLFARSAMGLATPMPDLSKEE